MYHRLLVQLWRLAGLSADFDTLSDRRREPNGLALCAQPPSAWLQLIVLTSADRSRALQNLTSLPNLIEVIIKPMQVSRVAYPAWLQTVPWKVFSAQQAYTVRSMIYYRIILT